MVRKTANHLLVDIGSSSVKFYLLQDIKLTLLVVKSLPLKQGFTPEDGLTQANKDALFVLINDVKEKHKNAVLHFYATALFRKMSGPIQKVMKDEFLKKFAVDLTIISPEEENYYLELAVAGKYHTRDPILIMNIGGGSTELLCLRENKVIERYNVELGVGTVMAEFPMINDDEKSLSFDDVKLFVIPYLPKINSHPKVAFVTGGELTYMKKAHYKLVRNNLFEDDDHPFSISVKDALLRNKEIFAKVSLKELESFMPENPTWMHGTRAFLVIADAICEKYHAQIIIPSDANLMNGIVRAHFQN